MGVTGVRTIMLAEEVELKTSDVYNEAADLIELNGKAQGFAEDILGKLCAGGAVCKATGRKPMKMYEDPSADMFGPLAKFIGDPSRPDLHSVYHWSDRTDESTVIKTLRGIARIYEGLGD